MHKILVELEMTTTGSVSVSSCRYEGFVFFSSFFFNVFSHVCVSFVRQLVCVNNLRSNFRFNNKVHCIRESQHLGNFSQK